MFAPKYAFATIAVSALVLVHEFAALAHAQQTPEQRAAMMEHRGSAFDARRTIDANPRILAAIYRENPELFEAVHHRPVRREAFDESIRSILADDATSSDEIFAIKFSELGSWSLSLFPYGILTPNTVTMIEYAGIDYIGDSREFGIWTCYFLARGHYWQTQSSPGEMIFRQFRETIAGPNIDAIEKSPVVESLKIKRRPQNAHSDDYQKLLIRIRLDSGRRLSGAVNFTLYDMRSFARRQRPLDFYEIRYRRHWDANGPIKPPCVDSLAIETPLAKYVRASSLRWSQNIFYGWPKPGLNRAPD